MMLDRIKVALARYEGTWILPDDLDALLEIIEGAMREGLECGPSVSRTHWPECWRWTSHHPCAVAEVEKLRAALEKILEEVTTGYQRDWRMVGMAARGALGEEA